MTLTFKVVNHHFRLFLTKLLTLTTRQLQLYEKDHALIE
jgi:hypothetical protein